MAWRYALALLLSLAVLFFWQAQMKNRVVPPEKRPTPVEQAGQEVEGAPDGPAREVLDRGVDRERETFEGISVDGVVRYTADSRGACLSNVFLPQFYETAAEEKTYQLVYPPHDDPEEGWGPGTLGISIERADTSEELIPWDENWRVLDARRPGVPQAVAFENDVFESQLLPRGEEQQESEMPAPEDRKVALQVRKTVIPGNVDDVAAIGGSIPEGDTPRHVKVQVEIRNVSSRDMKFRYQLYGPTAIDSESLRAPGSDIQVAFAEPLSDGRVSVGLFTPGGLTGGEKHQDGIAWVGVTNNYFAGILFPLPDATGSVPVTRGFATAYQDWQTVRKLAREKHNAAPEDLNPRIVKELSESAYQNVRAGLGTPDITLAPGGSLQHSYCLYVGPREKSELLQYGTLHLDEINHYGFFNPLVKFFIWLLGSLSFASWGGAIILLTLLVKLCLHPINKKSQASMQRFQKKMQKVKPEMDAIKERYGKNRMKMNQEMQKLWKERGINPGQQMAGCLILFLQLPIWIGLYRTLEYAIGLRQAGFLYISDLTQPDHLFPLGIELPFLGGYFNLLPVLYVILTIVNQRLQPRPEDPQMQAQYRMMTFMMVFFGFIFYAFPAGFMLYIMTSSGLGIIESKIIKAELAREENRDDGGGGRSRRQTQQTPQAPTAPYRAIRKKKPEAEGKRSRKKRRP